MMRATNFFACLLSMAIGRQDIAQAVPQSLGPPVVSVPPRDAEGQFGQINDALIDRAGNLYVVDSKDNLIAVFDRSGDWITSLVGSVGTLNGERFEATAIAIDKNDVVYLLDRRQHIVRKLKLRAKALDFLGSFELPAPMGALCILADQIYVIGVFNHQVVHRFDLSGRYLQSFGSPFSTVETLSNSSTNLGGHITCVPEAGVIAVATTMFSTVRAYSPGGSLLWEFAVPDFRQIGVHESSGGGLNLDMRGGSTDVLFSLFREAYRGTLAIQISEVRAIAIRTYFVDARSGKVVGKTDVLPPIVRSIRDKAFVIRPDGHPSVTVQQWR